MTSEYDGRTPVRRCHCNGVIGDGDWASGKRGCVFHRRASRRR